MTMPMTLEEANAIADIWIQDPDPWFRDLSAVLKMCINASEPPGGRYLKRDWIEAHKPFDHDDDALDVIYQMGLGNFGAPPPFPVPHYWSPGARIAPASEAVPLPVPTPIADPDALEGLPPAPGWPMAGDQHMGRPG